MNVHKNARLTPAGRVLMIERIESGWSVRRAAEASGVSERTAHRWLNRWRSGDRGLQDRSSAPHRCPRRLDEEQVRRLAQLRRERRTSPAIARILGLALSTVGLVLRRLGLNRLDRLEAPAPPICYERARPGEMIHLDIKSLAASPDPVIGSPATAATVSRGSAGSTCMSPSMTAPGWPTPKCSMGLAANRQRPSCSAPSTGSAGWVSASSG
jgi:transposase